MVTELLTKTIEGYSEICDTNRTIQESLSQKQEEITSLQKTNMNLFLKVSNPIPHESLQKPEALQYEDLIKGMM